jgi:hypothetical protein
MALCECGCGEPAPLAKYSWGPYKKGEPQRFVQHHHRRGATHSSESRQRMSTAHKGSVFTDDHRARLRERSNDHLQSDRHYGWKGDAASYLSKHQWVYRRKPRTGECEECGTRPPAFRNRTTGTEFANVSGEYRRDVDDYRELCHACHTTFDQERVS